MLRLLLCLLLLPTAALAAEVEVGALTVPLPDGELLVSSRGDDHWEGKDGASGWRWRIEAIGAGRMATYPEPLAVRAAIQKQHGLTEVTDLQVVPVGGSLGSLVGARKGPESVRACWLGKAGSLHLITVFAARSAVEPAELALRAACKEAVFGPDARGPDPLGRVGLSFGPRLPVDWQEAPAPGPQSIVLGFNQSATGLTGMVVAQPRDGHPYDTDDLADLRRRLSVDGYQVQAVELLRIGKRDAKRVEAGRPGPAGSSDPWVLVFLTGKRTLWTVQSPIRTLGYSKVKELLDAGFEGLRLHEE